MAIVTVNDYANKATINTTAAEWWQVEGGAVRFQIGAPASDRDGILFTPGQGGVLEMPGGKAVTVWLDGPSGATITRAVVG